MDYKNAIIGIGICLEKRSSRYTSKFIRFPSFIGASHSVTGTYSRFTTERFFLEPFETWNKRDEVPKDSEVLSRNLGSLERLRMYIAHRDREILRISLAMKIGERERGSRFA